MVPRKSGCAFVPLTEAAASRGRSPSTRTGTPCYYPFRRRRVPGQQRRRSLLKNLFGTLLRRGRWSCGADCVRTTGHVECILETHTHARCIHVCVSKSIHSTYLERLEHVQGRLTLNRFQWKVTDYEENNTPDSFKKTEGLMVTFFIYKTLLGLSCRTCAFKSKEKKILKGKMRLSQVCVWYINMDK